MYIIPLVGLLAVTPCAAELGPEAPLPTPPAATLPTFRSEPGVGAEAPLAVPPGSTLPSMLSKPGVGPEAPLPAAPAATLPSFLRHGAPESPQPVKGGGSTITVPNGNGTTTIIHPDGSVETVPSAK